MVRSSTRLTAVFAKRPEPGAVKTRLVPPLAPEEAARLADAMLGDVCRRLSRGPFRLAVAYAPVDAGGWFEARLPAVGERYAQRGEGLAGRLASFFEDRAAAEPGTSVVVVGADAPLQSADRVERAHAALEDGADLVLGPDDGGGYDLVGLRRPERRLFTDVAMSTAGMCAATLARARELALATVVLESGFDVDVPADLDRLARAVARLDAAAPGFPRETAEWLLARRRT